MSLYYFIHPCPGAKVTSKFGRRKDPITGKDSGHQGIDLAQSGNVLIYAAADGYVSNTWGEKVSTYGNVVFLRHSIDGKTMDTTYAHLKSISVKVGQKVKQGDVIGIMGNTGRSTGQHLHFEVHNGPWLKDQPNAVDPLLWINKLKPTPKVVEQVTFNNITKQVKLPESAETWKIYPLDKAPKSGNEVATLKPKKFGGLTYDILATPQKDVVTIQTRDYGKVNIYVAPSTGAVIF